jgi:hypothetical protein
MGEIGHQDDVAALREAVRLLDERTPARVQIPSAGTEHLVFSTARLLEAIAASMEHGEPVADDVIEKSAQIARHIQHYIDVYLPRA